MPELNGDSCSSDILWNDNREVMTEVNAALKSTVRLRKMGACIVRMVALMVVNDKHCSIETRLQTDIDTLADQA